MSGLQISPQQAGTLSDDVVRRYARNMSRQTDTLAAAAPASAPDTPPAAARLAALHAALRADLDAKAGPAAEHLAVDMALCAQHLDLALRAGAVYREPAAAAQLWAAAALGARWLGDERLCIDREAEGDEGDGNEEVVQALPEPREPEQFKVWAEASWSTRFQMASERARHLHAPTRYALGRAIDLGFSAESLRSIADAVFEPGEVEPLTRFLGAERALVAAAGLDTRSLGDRRVESLCIGADLVYGLGRFVRLATAAPATPVQASGMAASTVAPDGDRLFNHLRKALDALAEHPEQ